MTQTSADLGQALAPQPGLDLAPASPPPGAPIIHVDDTVRYQHYIGAGGAMTDSAAWLMWSELPATQRNALLSALFSRAGAHMSFLRVPMGASDFTALASPYSYDDQPPGQSDPTLAGFSIAHDKAYILPALRAAEMLNPSLYLEAVPWSPPAWMKANGALDNTGHAGTLLPQYYPTLARYFVRFLQAYAAGGVRIAAVSPQNEPDVPTSYPGLELDQGHETAFVAGDLRPALAAAGLTPALFGWDLSWGPLNGSDSLVTDSQTGLLTGLAWHCYAGSPTFMANVHALAPNSEQIVDECTTGSGDIWATSEALIATLRNWASAVALWNLALDPSGGPVQPPDEGCGGCTGIATVNGSSGTYTLSKDYYELAQLSHFVMPDAVRISSQNFVTYTLDPAYQTTVTPGVDDVAFRNPDGSLVLMAYNNSGAAITFGIAWRGRYATYTIPAGATTTFDWR